MIQGDTNNLQELSIAFQNVKKYFAEKSKSYAGLFGIVSTSRLLNSKPNIDTLEQLNAEKDILQTWLIQSTAVILRAILNDIHADKMLSEEEYQNLTTSLANISADTNLKQAVANKNWNIPPLIKACNVIQNLLQSQEKLANFSPDEKNFLANVHNITKSLQTELTAIHDTRESKKRSGVSATNIPPFIQKSNTVKRTLQTVWVLTGATGTALTIAGLFFPPLAPFGLTLLGVSAVCSIGLIAEKAIKNRWRNSTYDIELTKEQKIKGVKIAAEATTNAAIIITIGAFGKFFPLLAKIPAAAKDLRNFANKSATAKTLMASKLPASTATQASKSSFFQSPPGPSTNANENSRPPGPST